MNGRYEPAKPARQTGTGHELGQGEARLNHRAAVPEIVWILVDNCGQLGGCEYRRHAYR